MPFPYTLPFDLEWGPVVVAPDPAELTTLYDPPPIVNSGGKLVQPDRAPDITITGGTPRIVNPQGMAPNGVILTLTGGDPQVLTPVAVTPDGVTLYVTGSAPEVTVTNPVGTFPTGAALTITPAAPKIGTAVTPTGAILTVTGAAPTVRNPTDKTTTPYGAALTIMGGVPVVEVTGITAVHHAVVDTRTELERLNDDLLHGDPISRADAAEKLASRKTTTDTTWTVTVYDKLWRPVGVVGDDLMELSGTDPRNNLPTATLKIKGDSTLLGVMEDCQHTMVGVTVETAGLRYAYYVDTFDYEFQDDCWVGTAHLNGIWDVLSYLVIWPNWLLPIQVQIPSHAIFIWALCTAVETMIAECALRIQSGLNEFINNALSLNPDIRAWFGTLLQSNGNILEMLKCPIYIVHTNPFLDTSPLIARTVRMESCATVIRDVTRAYGVDVRVDLWLPGDEQPDEWTKNFAFVALTQPTYVVSVKDRSQITGPTGTILDSVLRTVVDLGGTFLSDIIPGLFQQIPSMEGVYIAPLLGVNWVAPWALLIAPESGHKGSVVSCKLSYHTPKGWQHIIGGRSPKWLNDLINAFTAWLIDSVSILLGFTGIPSSLLEGFLNNAFLAFQLVEHYGRRNQVGPYHPAIEVFHATSSAPYNIETLFGFVNALWDSRGWVSCVTRFRNAEVYTLGKDIFRGGLVSVLYPAAAVTNTGQQIVRRKLYTDYIENVSFHLSEDTRDIILQIGDGKAKESPLAKHQRFITGVLESINVVTLAPSSGGFL